MSPELRWAVLMARLICTAALTRGGLALAEAAPIEAAPIAPVGKSESPRAHSNPSKEEEQDQAPRALERALVEKGGLLLAPGSLEVAPALAYTLSAVDTTVAQGEKIYGQRTRSHLFTGSLMLRLGLPLDFQASALFPFALARRETVLNGALARDAAGAGPGDIRLAMTRQVLRSRAGLPDLLATAFWQIPTGSSPWSAQPDRLGLGNGTHALGLTVSMVKSFDPLVFLASGSFTASASAHTSIGEIKPGDEWELMAGTLLAVSPESSLSIAVSQRYATAMKLDQKLVVGSERTGPTLQLGVAMLLLPRLFLSVTSAIGLTPDVPTFQFIVSAPVQVR